MIERRESQERRSMNGERPALRPRRKEDQVGLSIERVPTVHEQQVIDDAIAGMARMGWTLTITK